LAHQILDQSSGHRFYPIFVVDRPVQTATVLTVNEPEHDYQEEVVYDMEASAFWSTASCFSTAELIHCYKVISDNRQSDMPSLTKTIVEELITGHMTPIENFIRSLQNLSQFLNNLELSFKEINPFLERWHFTNTQQCQLKKLLRHWKACTGKSTNVLLEFDLLHQSNSREVLRYLEKYLQRIGNANV
jgi:adenosylhomocysteine nucleosidase